MSVYQQFFGSASAIPNQTNTSAASFFPQIGGGGGGGGTQLSTFNQIFTSSINNQQLNGTISLLASGVQIPLAPTTISSLTVSSINGAAPGGGGGGSTSLFSTASISSLTVSSINGAAPGGGGSLVQTAIPATGNFSTGTSTVVLTNSAASPVPPTPLSEVFTLQPNRVYQFSAQANFTPSQAQNSEGLRWFVANANTGESLTKDFNLFPTGRQNTNVPWSCVFPITTSASTISTAQFFASLEVNLSVLPISTVISPIDPAGYSFVLTDLGARP